MLRLVFAALAGGIAIRLWAVASTALLPWPVPAIGSTWHPVPTAALPAAPPPKNPLPAGGIQIQEAVVQVVQDPTLQEPAFGPAELPPLPSRGIRRTSAYTMNAMPFWNRVGIDLALGIVAALAVVITPATTAWPRQLTLLVLGGLFAVLLADLSLAARVDWPSDYLFVLCLDHFVSILLVALVVTLTMRLPLPPIFSQTARKSGPAAQVTAG